MNEDATKIKIFELMEDIRTKVTKLQIECYRGEKKRKPRIPPWAIEKLEEEIEES